MQTKLKAIGAILVAILVASLATYWFGPKRVKVVEREKVVVKTVEVVKKDVRTVRTTTEKPTGEKVTVEVIEDRSKSESASREEKERTRTVEKAPLAKDWLIGGSYGLSDRSASLTVQRRIIGSIYGGITGSVDPRRRQFLGLGLSLSWTF